MIGGFAEGLPVTLIAVAVVVAFAALFSLVLSVKLARERHAEQTVTPAYDMWDYVDDFMIFQAACLWAGREPKRPVPQGKAYAAFTMIKGALRAGAIQAATPNIEVDQFIRVTRGELRKLAESKGMRPRFLFPDG